MKLIEYYEQQQDDQRCVLFTGKYLKIDKYAEPVYRCLMRCHARMGNKSMVIKTFKKCEDAIEREFNCSLSPQSIELFQRLVPA